ncbi:phytoene desaturase family protein [Nocardioides sp. CPCC 205120]|uniref:phytoene desaturase family protein n=1 Tax=Nocardioides sp. CPCC 205120 TaxID=3406462 RepID=UPI003B514A66
MTTATVVGSGPNGMAAALTLAGAGVRVTVVEAADRLGGGVRTSELTLPGLLHDECAAFHPLGPSSPYLRSVELEGAGLRWAWAPHELAHPLAAGGGAVLQRSVAATAAGLGDDGRRWAQVFGPLVERFGAISREVMGPVLHVPSHPLALARFGLRSAAPATLLARAWRGPAAAALFGGVAAHAMRPLDSVFSSAIGVMLTTAAHADGWPVAVGGSEAILRASLRRAEELGVRLETGRCVTSIDELGTDLVLLDTRPAAAARILGRRLPARVRRAFERYVPAPGVFKVDLAVEGGVPWRHEQSRRAGTVHVGGDLSEVAYAEREVVAGRMPARPFVLVGQQHLADPTRSKGDVHPVYAYAHVPHGYDGDATDSIVSRIEEFAPGFKDRILATASRSVSQGFEKNANLDGGDVIGGAGDLRQLVFRPRVAADPYATGVPGAFLCSASTPPGAGAHGMCGYLAARSALRSLA